ncbi:stalk domain-containing protein [Brevibacillus sp. MER 51]|uniref:stalk domain-containing protein n=1 Tax=Brevibacillus sp. MER 51 TaxID=2939560 RepID=UPI00203EC867|nr:stalk domain-containing protein [Brevibacillus sp. MER 51]MCM3145843.1 stalk domain-containing protein [Brevibacillus sp. MER 51]
MFKKQYLAIASALILSTTLIPTSSQAATGTKNLQAKYNNIKVIYNGAAVPTTIEPFIVNGTTYIPLRMMAGVFSKDVAWDGAKYTITVKDLPNSQHANELAARDAQIRSLQNTIDSLNKEITDLKNSKKNNSSKDDDDLDDLEDDLNNYYDDYKDIEWKISLSGDEDDIDVEIQVDREEFEDEYEDLDESDFEELVEKVVEDIWDEFEDADIDGEIVDEDDDNLYDFSADASDGDITFEGDVIN